MKKFRFSLALAILFSMVVTNAFASVAIDGIYYYLDSNSGTAMVTYYSTKSSLNSTAYKGSIVIPESITYYNKTYAVTSIGGSAFSGCSGLTSITIPSSVTSIGSSAFYDCSGLTKVIVSDIAVWCGMSFSSYLSNPLFYAKHLYSDADTEITDLVIPDGVTSIGDYLFFNCHSLTSVTIPSSVTSIGMDAFRSCSGLTSVTIPGSVTSIGSFAFDGCSGLTSVSIPSSVTSIGDYAFRYCSGLTSVTIPSSVTSIGSYAFSYCSGLTSVTIPSSVTKIGSYAFDGCSGLTSVTIPNSVTSIDDYAFAYCSGLTSVTIPSSVTSIGSYAFYKCSRLTSVTLGDNVAIISFDSFPSSTTLYTKHKTQTLFSLWSGSYKKIYEQGTSKSLAPPYLKGTSTQTSLKVELNNMYSEYTYESNGTALTSSTIEELTNWYPEYSAAFSVTVKYGDLSYTCSNKFSTSPISPTVKATNVTASSATIKGSYITGDANVVSNKLVINGKTYEGNTQTVKGLNPGSSYTMRYEIEITWGVNNGSKKTYYKELTFKTQALTLTTSQPKIVSLGNCIVAATANVDEGEENVGFEWRRTDWTNDFASNTGKAYIYEGTMEGYIRNLNTDKLWKFRPYYLSDSGTYYYGDWVGLDPTNVSYFEPTIHTYAQIVVDGNTALVKGYALEGSDGVTVQGFKYWKSTDSTNRTSGADILTNANTVETNRASGADIPSNAIMVESSGTVMEASLPNLDYDTSYSYVAFATTSSGTYYGEIRTFATGANPTGIISIKADETSADEVYEVARYNMQGRRIAAPEKGINIVKMSDSTTRKIVVR